MTVYLKIPKNHSDICRKTLEGIGYWGQANSFACCVDVKHNAPQPGEYAMPFASLPTSRPTQNFFSCLVSDFRDKNVSWEEILPTLEAGKFNGIQLAVYVWPLIIIEQQSNRKLLMRFSLN